MSALSPASFQGTLSLKIHKASGLHNTSTFGQQDPYCAIRLDSGEPLKTRVHENGGVNPVWNDVFEFPLEGKESALIIEIWDEDVGRRDDKIGYLTIPLTELLHVNKCGVQTWYHVFHLKGTVFKKEAQKGSIQLTANFNGMRPNEEFAIL